MVFSTYWELDDEERSTPGPTLRDVEEAIVWGRDRSDVVLVRLGRYEEGIYSAGKRRATREIEELGGKDLRPFPEWPPLAAQVVGVESQKNRLTVWVDVPQVDRLVEPIVPAGLYSEQEPALLAFPLHRLVGRDESVLEFQTFELGIAEPDPGSWHVFRSWWAPEQLELARDTALTWTYERVPEGEEISCALTWEVLLPGQEGYRAGDAWITAQTYEDIVRDDLLRIRGPE